MTSVLSPEVFFLSTVFLASDLIPKFPPALRVALGIAPIFNGDGFSQSLQHLVQLISWRYKSQGISWAGI